MDWNTITLTIIGVISGGGLITGWVQLRTIKSTQLKAQAEAESVNIDNHQKIDDRWEKFVDQLQENHKATVAQMNERISTNEKAVLRLESKLETTNRKLEQKRYSINKAFMCKIPGEQCPVLLSEIYFDRKNACVDCEPNAKLNDKG